ncbi:phosphatase [Sporosarcina sp. BI001-red]|uniref:phosphatase n=1 Tax=Sporosarcina sp. BI001-red TaxID=2282866 RepID=UPI000E254602|nr:phosphatase [Sporosarcina sp. BI001-red]REB07358.1 phosphatase [Sporosarcina sp. BI001-red]
MHDEGIERKNTNIGLVLLLSSAIIFGSAIISASIYSLTLGSVGGPGWNSNYGIFGTALLKVGTLPLIISLLLVITAIILIVKEIENFKDNEMQSRTGAGAKCS